MRLLTAVLCLALLGCPRPDEPYSELPDLQRLVRPAAGQGLTLVDQAHPGGPVGAVAADGEHLFVATRTSIDVRRREDNRSVGHLTTAGEPRELLVLGDELWVAAGSGGIARIENPGDPDAAVVTEWPAGDCVVAIAGDDDRIWAADRWGFVLTLPRCAAPGELAQILAIDGWPGDIVPFGDGALVAAGAGGLIAVALRDDGTLALDAPPFEPRGARAVVAHGDRLYVISDTEVICWQPQQRHAVPRERRIRQLVATEAGVVAAAGEGGLFSWDGRAAEGNLQALHQPGITGVIPVRQVAGVGGGDFLVAGGDAGAFMASLQAGEWQLEPRAPRGGNMTALEPWGDRVVSAFSALDELGTVVVHGLDPAGQLRERGRAEVPSLITDVEPVSGDELIVTGYGLYSVRWGDNGEAQVKRLPLLDDLVHAVELQPDGRLVALVRDRGLLWLIREGPGHWVIDRISPLGADVKSLDLVLSDDVAGVTYGSYGRLKLYGEPGAPPTRDVLLAGAAAGMENGWFEPAGSAVVDGRFWVAMPRIGIEGVDAVGGARQRIELPREAWDVAPAGERLAVALGRQGVVVVDPAQAAEPIRAAIDLPGRAQHVVVTDDGFIVAGTGGSLFVVTPP